MAKLIDVEERDLQYIFGKSKPYSIDVYQRDYRWTDEKDHKLITQLLVDIELRFEHNMKIFKRNLSVELKQILNDVENNFQPYFLNTIMLNEQEGDIYIVDGQQRLTTILLIMIKLFHIGKQNETGGMNVEKQIGEKIYEEDMASVKQFKISNEDRNVIIKKIFDKSEITPDEISNISQANLVKNYQIISKYYDKYFFTKEGLFLPSKYAYYVYNLLLKVLTIEQIIKRKEDVAMIFESANDRGKELEPHEVLKGMLLGVMDIKQKEECNVIWNEALRSFYALDRSYHNVDEFFRTYFRAKYADNQYQYQLFAGKYHRNLLSNDKIIEKLDRSDPAKIESFIKNEFKYFYTTYQEIIKNAKEEKNIYLASNHANEQGQQYLLILSVLINNDPNKDAKISLVAKKYDQFYTIANMVGAYDNNEMQIIVNDLNSVIRNKPLEEISSLFDSVTIPYFNKKGFPITSFNDIFVYQYFEKTKIKGQFTKYLLARVDHYLADLLHEQSFAKEVTLQFITHSGSKSVNGFHTEHIYSNNEKIMDQFKDASGQYNEKLFNDERNRIGAVILLKGNENIRTGNLVYKHKIKSYRNSGFIWNRIMTNAVNPASLNSCMDPIKEYFKSYEPDDEGLLTISAINERQWLLFELIKKIYIC